MKHYCVLFLIISLFLSFAATAQEMSPHEQKRAELANETLEELLKALPSDEQLGFAYVIYMLEQSSGDEREKLLKKEDFIINCCALTELFNVGSNMKTLSFDYNTSNSGISPKWIEIGRKYVEKRNAVESLKIDDNDLIIVKRRIKKKFDAWASKKEYENTDRWEVRLTSEGASVFDETCAYVISNIIEESFTEKLDLSFPDGYDADRGGAVLRIDYMTSSVNEFLKMSPERYSIMQKRGISLVLTRVVLKDGHLFPAVFREESTGRDIIFSEGEDFSIMIKDVSDYSDKMNNPNHAFIYNIREF